MPRQDLNLLNFLLFSNKLISYHVVIFIIYKEIHNIKIFV